MEKPTGSCHTLFCLFIVFFSCEKAYSPEEILEKTKEKYLNAAYISYSSEMHWPNPLLPEVDTFYQVVQFEKHPNKFWDYNYVGMGDKSGLVYINDIFSEISHKDSTVRVYSDEEIGKRSDMIPDNMFTTFSPIKLLDQGDFTYRQDSLVGNMMLKDYFFVSMDTTIGDLKIIMEKHVFIEAESLEIPLILTKLYHNSKEKQFISVWFYEISFDDLGQPLSYISPENYLSKTTDDIEKIMPLESGTKAPDFSLEDLEGKKVSLQDFRGKKVLIDFSMINCGWCKYALDKFNDPGFEFRDEVVTLYINPIDKKERMEKYIMHNIINFPVLTDAKETGLAYGVSGYPTFFIIDENGVIEKTFVGFQEEMMQMVGKMD